jgi:RHS repeat-associated protein
VPNTSLTRCTIKTIASCYSKSLLAMVTLILSIVPLANAQDDANPKRGFYPGGSYSVSDIETINTANGNLILTIPIASLPAGRGGQRGPGFSLTYNSKIWNVQTTHDPGEPGSGEGITFRDLIGGGGWNYSVPVYTLNTNGYVSSSDTDCNAGYVHKLTVTFPDGAEHEFYPSGYTIKSSTQGKHSRIRWDGWIATEFQIPGFCSWNYSQQTTNTMTYYSIDGSYLRLDVPHDNDQDTGNNLWILYFPDGSRVETLHASTTDFQRTYDRNNNYTDYERIHNYNGETGRVVDKLSDEFGRYILLNYGDPGIAYPPATVTAHGVNNEELQWTISWNNAYQTIINKTYCSHFAPSGCDSFNDVNVSFEGIDEITLPAQLGGLSYQFGYNATSGGWGELSSLTLPSGAVASYQYEQDGQNQIAWHKVRDNGVARKDLSYQLEYDLSSTATTESWFYVYNHTNGTTTITAPDNGVTTFTHHGIGFDPTLGEQSKGLLRKIERADGSIEETLYQTNTPSGVLTFENQSVKLNILPKTKFVSIRNASGQLVKTAVTDYSHDKNGNITAVKEYDWIDYSSIQRDSVSGQPLDTSQQSALTSAFLKRLSTTSYFNQTPDASDSTTNNPNVYSKGTSPRLRSLVAANEVGTGSQVQARSEFTYDDPNLTGNITQAKRWDSTKAAYSNPLTTANSIATSNQYEAWASGAIGKLVRTTDARGIQTKFTYGTVGSVADMYPTLVESALETPVQRKVSQEYDFYTGLVTKTTDVDNGISTKTTYDAIGRPTLVQSAFNLPEETQAATQYFDSLRRVVVRSDLISKGDSKLVSVQHYDQLGRVRLIRQIEDSSVSQAETTEAIGIKVQTRYKYTSGNSYLLTSSPYRAATSQDASAETTMSWTRTKNDVGGRVVEIQTFAGAVLPAPWGANATGTGMFSSSFDGYLTTVTDQAQKIRRSKVDALGRLVRVDEPVVVNGIDQLGTDSSPLQLTAYTYDSLDNLRTVSQGNRTRNFDYSSLSRLTSGQSPENGSISYKYDENGNLKVKTDARLVSTHYKYDQVNRVTKRWYNSTSAIEDEPSNENLPAGVAISPQANFYYDVHPTTSPFIAFQSQDKSVGRLTAVTYGANSTEGDYYRYDVLGRIFSKIQRVGTKDYPITAQYNRANGITLLSLPSNRTISNSFDPAGRLSAMSGTLGDSAKTYTAGIVYTASGSLTKEQFGTNIAIFNKRFYNARQQLAEILASTTEGNTWDRGKILNQYSLQCSGVGCNATDNNGNLRKQEIYIPPKDQNSLPTSWYQQYDYDELSRLKRVHEYTGNTNRDWQQEYDYDRWGNRTINANGTFSQSVGLGIIPEPNYAVDTILNNNRLTAPTGHTMTYDDAGNVKTDSYSGPGTRKYDAENRMIEWGDANGAYTYDANGQRVRRKVNGVETWQVYGIQGEMLAEYPANGSETNPTKEYGYRNGELLISAESGIGFALPEFGDDFNDNSLNLGSWTKWYQGSPNVTEQSQQLQISLIPSTAAYNGIYSNSTYNLTNKMVQVESVQAVSQSGSCENYMELELDANNYLMIQVGAGSMIFRSRVNGVNNQTSIPFDSVANRFWRIRHDQSANFIYFETKATNGAWLVRKTVTPGFSLTALRFHLLAGAYSGGNSTPGSAIYDNFKLLPSNSESVSLNVPNGGFEAPVVGNGSWQYAPSGGSWSFQNGGGVTGMNSAFTGTPSAAPQGVQVAFIQATGTISQSISGFQSNANYVITFSAIQRTNCCNTGGQDIGVYIDNTQVATFHPGSSSYSEYSTTAFPVTSGAHTVKFAGLNPLGGDHTAFMDNVRITGIPKPGYGIQWMLTDQLGTPRMIFDESSALANVKRHDYLPFGEELTSQGLRDTTGLGYSTADGVRQQFTSKERDTETGLDYFLARYYSSIQGRFISPDELSGGPREISVLGSGSETKQALPYAEITNPQSINKYQYVYNNPLRFIDPDGHQQDEKEGVVDQFLKYLGRIFKGESREDGMMPNSGDGEVRKREQNGPLDADPNRLTLRSWKVRGQQAQAYADVYEMADPTGIASFSRGWMEGDSSKMLGGVLQGIIRIRGTNIAFSEAKSLVGGWSRGTFTKVSQSLNYHFAKHGFEVGAENMVQYMRKAAAFGSNLRGAQRIQLENGATQYMKNGYYIIKDQAGKILSYGKIR